MGEPAVAAVEIWLTPKGFLGEDFRSVVRVEGPGMSSVLFDMRDRDLIPVLLGVAASVSTSARSFDSSSGKIVAGCGQELQTDAEMVPAGSIDRIDSQVRRRKGVPHGHERRGDDDPLDTGATDHYQSGPIRIAAEDMEVLLMAPDFSFPRLADAVINLTEGCRGGREWMCDGYVVVAGEHSLDLLDALQHSGRASDSRVQELLGLYGAGHDDRAGCVSECIDTFDDLVESALLD